MSLKNKFNWWNVAFMTVSLVAFVWYVWQGDGVSNDILSFLKSAYYDRFCIGLSFVFSLFTVLGTIGRKKSSNTDPFKLHPFFEEVLNGSAIYACFLLIKEFILLQANETSLLNAFTSLQSTTIATLSASYLVNRIGVILTSFSSLVVKSNQNTTVATPEELTSVSPDDINATRGLNQN